MREERYSQETGDHSDEVLGHMLQVHFTVYGLRDGDITPHMVRSTPVLQRTCKHQATEVLQALLVTACAPQSRLSCFIVRREFWRTCGTAAVILKSCQPIVEKALAQLADPTPIRDVVGT